MNFHSPAERLQYSTLQAWAKDEDLCDKFEQLQPNSQMPQQVAQKTAAEFPDCTESHDDG